MGEVVSIERQLRLEEQVAELRALLFRVGRDLNAASLAVPYPDRMRQHLLDAAEKIYGFESDDRR